MSGLRIPIEQPDSLLRLMSSWLPGIDDVIEDIDMNFRVRKLMSCLSQDDRKGLWIAAQDPRVPSQHVRFEALEQHHAFDSANLFEFLVPRPWAYGQLVDNLFHIDKAVAFQLLLPWPRRFGGRAHLEGHFRVDSAGFNARRVLWDAVVVGPDVGYCRA